MTPGIKYLMSFLGSQTECHSNRFSGVIVKWYLTDRQTDGVNISTYRYGSMNVKRRKDPKEAKEEEEGRS